MLEESGLPHSRRTVEVGVSGSHRRLESAALRRSGNDRSSTSIEIDKRSRTSIEIDVRLSTS